MTEQPDQLVKMFLDALNDADKYKDFQRRLLYLTSEHSISHEILSAYVPGVEPLKDRAKETIARQLGAFLLSEGHINFSEIENGGGGIGGGPEYLTIRGTIQIVRPK